MLTTIMIFALLFGVASGLNWGLYHLVNLLMSFAVKPPEVQQYISLSHLSGEM